jgi:hypothetical protein
MRKGAAVSVGNGREQRCYETMKRFFHCRVPIYALDRRRAERERDCRLADDRPWCGRDPRDETQHTVSGR